MQKRVVSFIWTGKLLKSITVLLYLGMKLQCSRHSSKSQGASDEQIAPSDWWLRVTEVACEDNNSRVFGREQIMMNTLYFTKNSSLYLAGNRKQLVNDLKFTDNGDHIFIVVTSFRFPPAVQETPVWFLGWEDWLEKGWTSLSNSESKFI